MSAYMRRAWIVVWKDVLSERRSKESLNALLFFSILLLDEPFTGLDRSGRKWLNEYLMSFKARGGAFVLATHSFDAGIGVADRVAILAGGGIALDRPAAGLGLDDLRRLYDDLAMGAEAGS